MNEKKILYYMVKDHCKIEKLLGNLEDDIDKEFQIFKKSFIKFEY